MSNQLLQMPPPIFYWTWTSILQSSVDNVIVSHYCKVIEFSSEGLKVACSKLVVMVAKVNWVFPVVPAWCTQCVLELPENHYVDKLDALLSNDVNSSYEQSTDTECADVK